MTAATASAVIKPRPQPLPAQPHPDRGWHCWRSCSSWPSSRPGSLYSPTDFDYQAILQPPSMQHPFGTDNFATSSPAPSGPRGIDMQIAPPRWCPLIVGSIVGAAAGYYGKWSDSLFGIVVNIVIVFPFLVLVIVIVAFLRPRLDQHVHRCQHGGLGGLRTAGCAYRWCRSRPSTLSARVMGYTSGGRIISRHLLPNVIAPAIVFWMTDMSLGILLGASLGYLAWARTAHRGMGVMVADGKNFGDHQAS
ncbi:MAG: hypothetical protein R2838_23340 [Caldilineaceae bacterium]